MNKGESIAAISDATGYSKKDVKQFFEHVSEVTEHAVKKRDQLFIPGIGKLFAQDRKARIGRNPQTGEKIKIKAKTVVKIRLEKSLKDLIKK